MHTGFIGAGFMGHGMAVCLLAAGHQVTVLAHRNRAPVDDLLAKGAREGASAAAVAARDATGCCGRPCAPAYSRRVAARVIVAALAAGSLLPAGRSTRSTPTRGHAMNVTLVLGPIISIIAGILILVMPRLLNYIVAVYLIVSGLIALFGSGNLRF